MSIQVARCVLTSPLSCSCEWIIFLESHEDCEGLLLRQSSLPMTIISLQGEGDSGANQATRYHQHPALALLYLPKQKRGGIEVVTAWEKLGRGHRMQMCRHSDPPPISPDPTGPVHQPNLHEHSSLIHSSGPLPLPLGINRQKAWGHLLSQGEVGFHCLGPGQGARKDKETRSSLPGIR